MLAFHIFVHFINFMFPFHRCFYRPLTIHTVSRMTTTMQLSFWSWNLDQAEKTLVLETPQPPFRLLHSLSCKYPFDLVRFDLTLVGTHNLYIFRIIVRCFVLSISSFISSQTKQSCKIKAEWTFWSINSHLYTDVCDDI